MSTTSSSGSTQYLSINSPHLKIAYQAISNAQVADTYDALHNIDAELENLLKEEEALELERRNKLAFISPIRLLPPELLSLIFEYYVDSCESPWSLLHISRTFHFVAINTPRLWSFILLKSGPNAWYRKCLYDDCFYACSTLSETQIALNLARATPLEVIIRLERDELQTSLEEEEKRLKFFIGYGYTDAWRKLSIESVNALVPIDFNEDGSKRLPDFKFVGTFRGLVELDLSRMIPSLVDVLNDCPPPNLRVVTIGDAAPMQAFGSHHPWLLPVKILNLRAREWNTGDIDYLTPMMAACALLEELQVSYIGGQTWGIDETTIVSPYLHTMSLGSNVAFVRAKFASLTTLTLCGTRLHQQDLTSQYLQLPVLENLICQGAYYTLLQLIKAPQLRSLHIEHFDSAYISRKRTRSIWREDEIVRTWKLESQSAVAREDLLVPRESLTITTTSISTEVLLKWLKVVGREVTILTIENVPGSDTTLFHSALHISPQFEADEEEEEEIICPKVTVLDLEFEAGALEVGDRFKEKMKASIERLGKNRAHMGRPVRIDITFNEIDDSQVTLRYKAPTPPKIMKRRRRAPRNKNERSTKGMEENILPASTKQVYSSKATAAAEEQRPPWIDNPWNMLKLSIWLVLIMETFYQVFKNDRVFDNVYYEYK